MREKFVPQSDEKLIFNHDCFGPLFGNNDIYISDGCNNGRNSYGDFPSAYNRAGEDKLTKNQDSYRMFSGATDWDKFRVVEYEVFKVHYQ